VEKKERERGVGSPCSTLHHLSQPSSHNYYHHLDLTLSTLVLFYPTVYTRCLQCLDRFNLLKKLLHYINGTKNWTLNYFRDTTVFYEIDFVFFCNVDAAHAGDDESHRSTGGWFFFLRKGQGAVAAKSGQTTDIPLSSTESDTIWGSNAAMQGAFLKQFLDETRLFKTTSFEMHEDSQPMINAQKRNVSQSRFKHMRTKHHYIRKLIHDGWCKLIKIQSKSNTADMAAKILPAKTVSVFSKVSVSYCPWNAR
jgi:hypothetical protein